MAKKDKLGTKGLDMLFGKEFNQTIEEFKKVALHKNQTTQILIDKIKPNPYQPRRVFDKKDLEQLATSIKNTGLIQPITLQASANGEYALITGERRLRASRLAGKKDIKAIVIEVTNEMMREMALVENIQRVNLTPIEEATAFKELIQVLKLKQSDFAERIGRSRVYVTNTLRLLKLPDYIQDLIAARKMSMGQSRPLIALIDTPKKLKYAVNLIKSKHLTAQAVEDLVRNLIKTSNTTDSLKQIPQTINLHLAGDMSKKLNTKVKITNTSIIIRYRSVNQLNQLLIKMGLVDKGKK